MLDPLAGLEEVFLGGVWTNKRGTKKVLALWLLLLPWQVLKASPPTVQNTSPTNPETAVVTQLSHWVTG